MVGPSRTCTFRREGRCVYPASEVLLSPILVRPVREQLEHDRVIRLLQAKYKRKFDVAINPGNEQTAPVGAPGVPWYPDLVLQSGERTKKLAGVVEVETGESLNNLEAMSQWVAFGKLRVPFHLYVPAAGVDTARRLCTDLQVPVAEMWAYHAIGEQIRFTLVSRVPSAGPTEREPAVVKSSPRPRPKTERAPAEKPARRATSSAKAKGTAAKRVTKKAAPSSARKAASKRPARSSGSSRPPKRK